MRGSRDFDSRDAWQAFVDDVMRKANRGRGARVAEDMGAMRELNVAKLPVPSRLMREGVRVRIFEDKSHGCGTLHAPQHVLEQWVILWVRDVENVDGDWPLLVGGCVDGVSQEL